MDERKVAEAKANAGVKRRDQQIAKLRKERDALIAFAKNLLRFAREREALGDGKQAVGEILRHHQRLSSAARRGSRAHPPHAPTPWKVVAYCSGDALRDIEDAELECVAVDLAPANAGHIVLAANWHDPLVKALRKTIAWAELNAQIDDLPEEFVEARALLARIEEESR